MTTFRPTRAPRGRLARVGVILDTREPIERVREVARMCDGAGIESLWVLDRMPSADPETQLPLQELLGIVAVATDRVRVGAWVSPTRTTGSELVAWAHSLGDLAERLEITLSAGPLGEDPSGPEGAEHDPGLLEDAARALRSLMPGEVPVAIKARSQEEMEIAARVADDVVLSAVAAPDVDLAIERIRASCAGVGREQESLGIALQVPVSIGRTRAEAEARAHGEILFEVSGSPAEVGLFGTLEECQERVIALAHAGISDLRCILPNNPDIHDVIGQLTAIAVGTVDVLTPGAPRSRDPDPPEGWGGRGDRETSHR